MITPDTELDSQVQFAGNDGDMNVAIHIATYMDNGNERVALVLDVPGVGQRMLATFEDDVTFPVALSTIMVIGNGDPMFSKRAIDLLDEIDAEDDE